MKALAFHLSFAFVIILDNVINKISEKNICKIEITRMKNINFRFFNDLNLMIPIVIAIININTDA